MVPRLRAAGSGECALDTGPAEDREPAEEDGAEMVARWTKEQSPGGWQGAEDPGTAAAGRTTGPSGGRRDATRTRVSVPGLNMSFGAGLEETLHR